MSFTNTPERYGVISAAFHWLSAIIVYGMFALGLWMVTLSYYDGWYHKAPELHKSIGILLMMGLVIRVLWRVISPPPGPLPSYSPMTRLARKSWTSRIVPIAVRNRHQRLSDLNCRW
ncbi:putative cytochrome [Escherichia coli]|nr:putative cytochrome [Escherichia coli]